MATQSIVGTLDKHFDKPLVKLSPELREIADAYIPKWSELSAIERKTKAQEADRQRDVKNGLRIGQITRGNEKVPQRVCLPDSRAMYRKVIFWLAPNETRIPADQIPGAIAETLNPPPERNELAGHALNDLKVVERLKEEREQAKQLRIKFPHLKDGDTFLIGDLNDYLARQEMVAEIRHRREAIDHLDPASRWAHRQFEDGFNAVREPVVQARRGSLELPAKRCAELAGQRELFLDHWIELVGVGVGQHESYDIARDEVAFRKWEDKFISESPNEWQVDMERDNRIAPHLAFPCTPAELVEFVDTAIGIHCFSVPDAFRLAVTNDAPPAQQWGVTKSEIICVNWPMPGAAPPLENILDDIPVWVEDACRKIGVRGKGAAGSHLWNPAILAFCLSTKTPHKKWTVGQGALTNFLRLHFSDYLKEWEAATGKGE